MDNNKFKPPRPPKKQGDVNSDYNKKLDYLAEEIMKIIIKSTIHPEAIKNIPNVSYTLAQNMLKTREEFIK